MPNIIEINDIQDPALDVYARLTSHQLRRCHDLFIAETPKVILSALDAGCIPESILMERKKLDGAAKEILERCEGIPVYTADREVLSELTGFALTRSILCAMHNPDLPPPDAVCRDANRIAVLEDIVDPTNVGAIFRSAAALGMDGVLVTSGCCDPLHRRAARVSMGTVFKIPWTRIDLSWPDAALKKLRSFGFKTAALALNDDSIPIDDPILMREGRLAILLGTEGDGLTQDAVEGCDYTVRIPMSHGVNSLNVAAASAVAFWQLRQNPSGQDS